MRVGLVVGEDVAVGVSDGVGVGVAVFVGIGVRVMVGIVVFVGVIVGVEVGSRLPMALVPQKQTQQANSVPSGPISSNFVLRGSFCQ